MAAHHHYNHGGGSAAHFCYGACCCPSAAYTSCHGCHPPAPPHLGSDPHHHPPPPSHLVSDLHQPPYSSLSHPPELRHHYDFSDYLQPPYFVEETKTHAAIPALLRRIAALETTIRRRSVTAPRTLSLRDAAARTIQAHFRAFLVRRSRTLGDLKQLASIKSNLGLLKSAVSHKTHFGFNAFYHKSLCLQRRLDAIQGHDPLIRNGKIALSKDLVEFLNFLDTISVDGILQSTEPEIVMKSGHEMKAGNVRFKVEKPRTSGRIIDESGDDVYGTETHIPFEYVIQKQDPSVPQSCLKALAKQQDGLKVKPPESRKSVRFFDRVLAHHVVDEDSSSHAEIEPRG